MKLLERIKILCSPQENPLKNKDTRKKSKNRQILYYYKLKEYWIGYINIKQ